MNRIMLVASIVAALVLGASRRASAQDVIVIVNDAAPATSLTVDELGRVFQKERVRWANGLTLEPVDLADSHSARERFSRMVFGKSTAQVKSWWQTQVFAGRSVPPVELQTEAQVVEYVRLHAGAIAYVSSTTPVVDGVRRLRVAR
jgi:ABC-type phosphate transport system substrate-binding protein